MLNLRRAADSSCCVVNKTSLIPTDFCQCDTLQHAPDTYIMIT
jgi:hypothetical protein